MYIYKLEPEIIMFQSALYLIIHCIFGNYFESAEENYDCSNIVLHIMFMMPLFCCALDHLLAAIFCVLRSMEMRHDLFHFW